MGNACASDDDGKKRKCCCTEQPGQKRPEEITFKNFAVSSMEQKDYDQDGDMYGPVILSKEQLAQDTKMSLADYDDLEWSELCGSTSGLPITFKTTEGVVKDVIFTHRPLGLDFEKSCPIVITKVLTGSCAEELGIQLGWTITALNGQSVADSDFKVKYKMLKKETFKLPEKGPDRSPRDGS